MFFLFAFSVVEIVKILAAKKRNTIDFRFTKADYECKKVKSVLGRKCLHVDPCPLETALQLVRDLRGDPAWPAAKMSLFLAQLHEPSIASGVSAYWKSATLELSERTRVRCKISSAIGTSPHRANRDLIREYVL